MHTPLAALFAAALSAAEPAPESPPADKSGYHLFNPVSPELMRDLSTDRPDTTESPYTVDAGHVQVELSFVDYTTDRNNDEPDTRESLAVAPMLLKIGLLNNADLQIGVDPYLWERSEDRPTGASNSVDGFGDILLRLKVNLWGNDAASDAGDTAFAVMPFITFPTAGDELGSGNIEGGVILPLAVALPGEFSLGVMAEIDFIRSAADDRHVVDFVHTMTLARPLLGELAGYIEYAGFMNFNGDEDYRGFFDTGLTYALTADVQLDAGIRVGLTEAADDFGVFVGLSLRF